MTKLPYLVLWPTPNGDLLMWAGFPNAKQAKRFIKFDEARFIKDGKSARQDQVLVKQLKVK